MAKNANGRASRSAIAGNAYQSLWSARLQKVKRELEAIDSKLVTAAMNKSNAGTPLLKREQSALGRYKRLKREINFWEFSRELPKIVYQAMSGRGTNVLHAQAQNYGFPLFGDTLDLPMVLAGFHDWFAQNKNRILAADSDDGMMAGGDDSPALEKYRAARAGLAQIELMKAKREIISLEDALRWSGELAAMLRRLGERYQRNGYDDAFTMLSETLEEFRRVVELIFTTPRTPNAMEATAPASEDGKGSVKSRRMKADV